MARAAGRWLIRAGPPAAVKQFNKLAVRLAGHRLFPLWAALRHRGRNSGRQSTVPVAVIPTETTFLIALPLGGGRIGFATFVRPMAARSAGGASTTSAPSRHSSTRNARLRRPWDDPARGAKQGLPQGFIQLTRRAAGIRSI